MRSCVMRLVVCLDNLGLLMSSMNCVEGELLSIRWSRFPLGDFVHSFFHLDLARLLWFCFRAAVLILSFLRSIRGREGGSEDCPFAAFFASSSTSSLPSMPTCPAVQRIV